MDATTLEAFTAALLPEQDMRSVQVALATIAETKREPGETSFPDLGTILAVAKTAREFNPRTMLDPEDFPPDTEPVYAPCKGFPPPPLTGQRLLLTIRTEMGDLNRSLVRGEPAPEATQRRYDELCQMLRDPDGLGQRRLSSKSSPRDDGGDL